jgi:hypothetical protein
VPCARKEIIGCPWHLITQKVRQSSGQRTAVTPDGLDFSLRHFIGFEYLPVRILPCPLPSYLMIATLTNYKEKENNGQSLSRASRCQTYECAYYKVI